MTQPADLVPTPAAPPPPMPTLLRGPDGGIYRFADPSRALAAGYSPLSPEEQFQHQIGKEERSKGLTGSLEEAGKSGLNQLLLGIPGTITEARETPEERAHREAVEEYHHTARVLGGAAGFGGSLLAGGELFKGAALAGEAVSHAILPAEEAAHAALATKLAAKAADFATQGALMASPQVVVQAAFGDPQKAAETLLWGVGAGAALGGAGELLAAAGRGVVGAAGKALLKTQGVADTPMEAALSDIRAAEPWSDEKLAAIRSKRAAGEKLEPVRLERDDAGNLVATDGIHRVAAAMEAGDETISAILHNPEAGGPPELKDDLQRSLDKFASDRTVKVVGGERTQINKLSPERIKSVTDFAHEEGLIQPGMSRADVGRAIDEAHTKYGALIGDTLNQLDGLMTKGTAGEDMVSHALKPGEIGDRIMQELDTPELRMPMNADQRKALEMVAESAHMIPTTKVNGQEVVSFEAAQNFVSSLRKKWVGAVSKAQNEGGVKGLEVVSALDQMKAAAYQVARDTVHAAGDRVALASDQPALVGALARAKMAYSKVAELDKWAATAEKQAAGNRMVGLTDWLSMGQGPAAHLGSGIGGAIGGFAGGFPGFAGGFAIGKVGGAVLDFIGKKWGEDKGLVYLSALAHRAAKEGPEVFSAVMASEGAKRLEATMGQVRETVKRLAIGGIAETSARTQGHMAALLGSTSGLTPDQSYTKLGNHLTQLAANPAAVAQVTSALSSPYSTTAPAVSDAYQAKLAQTLGYLYQSLPKPNAPPAPFAPQTWSPTAAEKLAFHDTAEIVANPMSAMQHVAQGTLSDAHLHTLQTIYPTVYGMMKQQILQFSAEHPEVKLPQAERASVAKFLGDSLDALDTPDRVRALQASYAPRPGAPPGGPPPGQTMPKGKIRKMPSMATTFSPTEAARGET